MADTHEQERGAILLGIHQLLPPVHCQLLPPCAPAFQPDQEGGCLRLGGGRAIGFRYAQRYGHVGSCTHFTADRQTFPNRGRWLWSSNGSGTVSRVARRRERAAGGFP